MGLQPKDSVQLLDTMNGDNYIKKITTAKAAAILGWDVCFLRAGLKAGIYDFGVALNVGNGKRWTYRIYPEKFKAFVKDTYGVEIAL